MTDPERGGINLGQYSTAASPVPMRSKGLSEKDIGSAAHCVVAAGPRPVCAVCGTPCRVVSDQTGALQTGLASSPRMPLWCPTCRSVVCRTCAGDAPVSDGEQPCPKCGALQRLSLLLPSAVCDRCGAAWIVTSNPSDEEITYRFPERRALAPSLCRSCHAVLCFACVGPTAKCPSCSSTDIAPFLPGYTGPNAICTDVDLERGSIAFAAPGTPAARREEERAAKEAAEVTRLVEALSAPGYKIWVDKDGALKRLGELGSRAAPAVDAVMTCLTKPAYRISAVKALAGIGAPVLDRLPGLLGAVEGRNRDDASAAALAIGALAARGFETGVAAQKLREVLQRTRSGQGPDSGLRCAAAIALFAMKKLGGDETTAIVRDHAAALDGNSALFPPESYLLEILDIR